MSCDTYWTCFLHGAILGGLIVVLILIAVMLVLIISRLVRDT